LPSPATLREKVFKALVEVLRSLGGNVTRVEQSEEPHWKILRNLLGECRELVSGITFRVRRLLLIRQGRYSLKSYVDHTALNYHIFQEA
jgi:hypothetical protein